MTDKPIEETWSPDPVRAWRYWHVSDLEWNWTDDRFEASLIGDREVWDGPVKFAGQHKGVESVWNGDTHENQDVDHPSPHTGCLCGVNAVKELDYMMLRSRSVNYGIGQITVVVAVAPVELAGTVDEYELGYRAEQATIIGPIRMFNADQKLVNAVQRCYGVDTINEAWDSDWTTELAYATEIRSRDGNRKADPSDNRRTGTGQNAGTSEGTGEGWAFVKDAARGIGIFLGVAAGVATFLVVTGLLLTAAIEWRSGIEQDAECASVANQTGGIALDTGTFGDCNVLLPNGLLIYRPSIHWADKKEVQTATR